jgi:hypothetical protein
VRRSTLVVLTRPRFAGWTVALTCYIDTGRGWYAAGDTDKAVREFLRADDLAPQKVRTRPWVLELVGQMVRDARGRGGSDELRELAARCHIDPLAQPA